MGDQSAGEERDAEQGAAWRPDGGGRVEATDAARRRVEELGVELGEVRGTGSGGRVLVKDVERAAESGGNVRDLVRPV